MPASTSSLVWVPSPASGYALVEAVRQDATSLHFRNPESGTMERCDRDKVRPFFDEGKTVSDNTALTHLDDANILDNLRQRYTADEIYTYTCNVLLAVNPYKKLDIYTQELKDQYRGKNHGANPPHPYAIADVCYRNLLHSVGGEKRSQSLIISGESGAGKTETAKIVMHYLATVVSRTDSSCASNIQEKVINANPILESFGNAQTVRNVNSSRFGKYNKM